MGEELPRRMAKIVLTITFALLNIVGVTAQAEAPEQIIKHYSVDELITIYSDKYKVNEKLARDIIYCESRFNEDAKNLQAKVGVDIGLFQLNTYYWLDIMAEKGWNIYETEDNIEAGMWLMSIEGSNPWIWSKQCWINR